MASKKGTKKGTKKAASSAAQLPPPPPSGAPLMPPPPPSGAPLMPPPPPAVPAAGGVELPDVFAVQEHVLRLAPDMHFQVVEQQVPLCNIIFDTDCNHRVVEPRYADGTPHTMEPYIGPHAVVGYIRDKIVLRLATDEEKAVWLDKHEGDVLHIANKRLLPEYHVADGFGRCLGALQQFGPVTSMPTEIVATTSTAVARSVAFNLDFSKRKHHPLDSAEQIKLMKQEFKWNQEKIAEVLGLNKSQVSLLNKLNDLTDADRTRAIEKRMSMKEMIDIVNSYSSGGPKPPKAKSVKPKTRDIERLVTYTIPFLLGEDDDPMVKVLLKKLDTDSATKLGYGAANGTDAEDVLRTARVVFEWFLGLWTEGGRGEALAPLLDTLEGAGLFVQLGELNDPAEEIGKRLEKAVSE